MVDDSANMENGRADTNAATAEETVRPKSLYQAGRVRTESDLQDGQLIPSLTAQITQLQGALAQAGTELSLAKVELSLLKTRNGQYVEEEISGAAWRQVSELKKELQICQTELNLLRRAQSIEEDKEMVILKAQLFEEFTNGISARVERNTINSEPSKTLGQLNQEVDRKQRVINGLLTDIEHLKVDLTFQDKRCETAGDECAVLTKQVEDWKRKYMAMKDALEQKEISSRHSLIDSLAEYNDKNAQDVVGSVTKQKAEGEEVQNENQLLRTEVKIKDLALWLAHFEHKKEKKKKEVAEGKVIKMSDRLQKLMFICERHRKEIMDLKSQLDRMQAVKQGKANPKRKIKVHEPTPKAFDNAVGSGLPEL